MDAWEIIAERKIAEAMENGTFENLECAGKPVSLDEPDSEHPELRVLHRLLRNQGFTLSWIEQLNELRTAREQLCRRIDDYLQQSRSAIWRAEACVPSEYTLRD